MTEMQAVLGRIQLKRLPQWVRARNANAQTLRAALEGLPLLRIPRVAAHDVHAHYRLYAFVVCERLASGWTRDRLVGEIEAAGVPCGVGSCSEIYLERAFADRGWGPKKPLPVAKELGETSLMFLVHPTLTQDVLREQASLIRRVVEAAMIGQPLSSRIVGAQRAEC
jgi:dTDP-4-amino-4,6-dideoxygalactose transaminase